MAAGFAPHPPTHPDELGRPEGSPAVSRGFFLAAEFVGVGGGWGANPAANLALTLEVPRAPALIQIKELGRNAAGSAHADEGIAFLGARHCRA